MFNFSIKGSVIILLISVCSVQIFAQTKSSRPNIIVILADDLGWNDLSCYGSSFYETPNLDKLAADGIRFTQGYAASPVCSPTRASLLTGKYPTKTGVTDWIKGRQENGKAKPYEKLITKETGFQLNLEENTFAEFALNAGYKTFFAGKWHLGEEEKFWPQFHGFTTNKGGWSAGSPKGKINDSTGGFFTPYQNPMLTDGPKGEYITDRLNKECLQFIAEKKENPFLLFHSLYAVHNPLQAPKALVEKYKIKKQQLAATDKERFDKDEKWMKNEKDWKKRKIQDNPAYAAMIENMDINIGQIIDMLKANNLYENTLIIFASDNGGLSTAEGSPTSTEPLKGGKGWLYEGGIRVPMILKWGNQPSNGLVCSTPVNTIDIFPTIAKAINPKYNKPADIDGTNLFEIVSNQPKFNNRTLIWHYPHYSNQGGKPGAVIREGNFKLIYNYEDESTELYNIVTDVSELKNLADANKPLHNKLLKKLKLWLKQNSKDSFSINPNFISQTAQ